MHVSKKDHENCDHTGKKIMYFITKTSFIEKKKTSLKLHCIYAIFPMACDGHLRRSTRKSLMMNDGQSLQE